MGQDRTNNFVEAAHRRMRDALGADHPTIWKFIEGLRRVQAGRDKDHEDFVSGREPPRKRRRYVLADRRILRIVQRFHTQSYVDYLRGIANNFTVA
ncbi:hypothetical protein M514_14188 [Trichuris suis]|uniref:Uncharacterized protein n=1 Tax=Trichuris suis TaxID=68888 RepID=A0A085NPX0_9BILA|nr:hypothetical protein M514_14188 [Trichuris suis]